MRDAAGRPTPDIADCAALPETLRAGVQDGLLWAALRDAETCAARPGEPAARRALALRESGRLKLILGDAAGGRRSLEQALSAAPDDAEASYLLAQTLRETPDDALRHADRAVSRARTVALRAAAERLDAEILLDLGDATKARALLAKTLARDPDDLDALRLSVRAERARPKDAAARAAQADRAAEAAPLWLRPAAARLCARLWLSLDDPARAAARLTDALAAEPDDLDALEALVDLDRRFPGLAIDVSSGSARASVAEALPWTEDRVARALRASPENLPALGRLIELELARDRRSEATRAALRFVDAVAAAPEWQRAAAQQWVAGVWLGLGDRVRARQSLRRSRDFDWRSLKMASLFAAAGIPDEAPSLVGAYISVAQARALLGDAAGAEQRLAFALASSPGSPEVLEVLRLLAQSSFDRGRLPEAAAYADRLIDALSGNTAESPPESQAAATLRLRAAAYRLRASVRQARGDDAGARTDLLKALDDSPDDLDALATLSESEAFPPREALALVEKRKPKDETLLWRWLALRGAVRTRGDDRRRAEADLGAALKADPRGFCFGDSIHALHGPLGPDFFGRCVGIFPDSPALYADRGVSRYRLGDREGGIADLRRAVASAPDLMEARLSLVSALKETGRSEEALAEAERALAAAGGRHDGLYDRLIELRDSLRPHPPGSIYKE